MMNIRLPNITAQTEKGQLEQIRSYLYQFAQELNWAMANIDSKAEEATKKIVATTQQKDAVEQAQATFSEVKSLIIKSADIVNAYYEEISHRLEGVYVSQSEFGTYVEETSATLTANSEKIEVIFENQQTITTDVANLGDSLATTNETVEEISGGLESTNAQVSALDGRVESAESGLDETKGNVDSLGTKLDDDIVNVNKGLEGANKNIGDLKSAVESEQGKVSDLQKDMEIANETLDGHRDRLGGVEQGVGDLNTLIAKDGETTIVRSTNAWCKIGLLEVTDDMIPIYGMEIGQVTTNGDKKDFSAYARYCSNGVYLYDQNGNQVATIDQNKIDITNAEISNLVMGGYEISTSNGLTFKWKG